MTITPIQWMLITIAALGAISGGVAQMTDLFGPLLAKDIASAASFASSIISAILMPLTGQSAQIKTVLAMPGVDSLQVNRLANPVLAAIAVDPAQEKIDAIPSDKAQVAATAKAA